MRTRFLVHGIVQGVGFRPFVYGLAVRLELCGFVFNDSNGVTIEVEGPAVAVDAFGRHLRDNPPPLAVITGLTEQQLPPSGGAGFEIRHSLHAGAASALISADMATCDDCLSEMWDPADRRHRYAFINCTNCGPRFTISTGIPYDRPNTTMAGFEMCAECKSEYENPLNRRFHAQPVACPICGPRLALLTRSGRPIDGDPVEEAARMLLGGAILAVKGLGGYHLSCRAADEVAVKALRERKAREDKPFAVMVAGVEQARHLVEIGVEEEAILSTRRRPIVLLRRREGPTVAGVGPGVAPGNRYLGMMLPYTPLHHLLLERVGEPIVLTSGNMSDEPIFYRDEDALIGLDPIADAFLTHNRPIHMRCDDSVVRVVPAPAGAKEQQIRRSRGYAPQPITVTPGFARPVLAAGPELKHTFCVGVGDAAILSHHIGDLENYEAMLSFLEGVEHFQRVFEVRPKVVAYDLHPEYLVTKWALGLEGVSLVGVQHHHAHITSCMADNRRSERLVGLALDGTGYGEDGALWGCEVMICDLAGYRRTAHLRYVPLPGGARAVKQPWRMAAVYLQAAFGDAPPAGLEFVERTRQSWSPILKMAAAGVNSPLCSSAGRLFDAAAALSGMRDSVSYEGQAAIELEQAADPRCDLAYPCSIEGDKIAGEELIGHLAEDLAAGRPVPEAAAAFHNGLADVLVTAAKRAAAEEGLRTVALSGGSFQNQLLAERVTLGLESAGLEVLTHCRVPANDGGISLGQAVIANARQAY
ncbi:MAG: carbamoyltransferase HypF [Actinomycetota bacterium]